MKLLHSLLASAAIFSTIIGTAQAQIMTSVATSAPNEHLVWSTNPTGTYTNFNWNSAPARRDVGISFRASANGWFDSFTFQVQTITSPGGAGFTLQIFETSAFNSSPTTGVLRDTLTGTLPTTIASGDFLTFDLKRQVSITESRFYVLVLTMDDAANNRQLGLTVGSGDIPNSQLWYSNAEGNTFTRDGGQKVNFFVQQSIPEPGTTLLGISGALILGGAARGKLLARKNR